MASNRKVQVFGKQFLVDGRVKALIRKSPGNNARNRAIAKCARGKNLTERKTCFAGSKGVKGG